MSTCSKLSGDARADALSELALNLTVRIEDRVLNHFMSDGSISDPASFGNRHYYNLCCEEIARNEHLYEVWKLDAIVSKLRSNVVFHGIYAMVFHQWVMFSKLASVKNLNLFMDGAKSLFDRDRSNRTILYRPIYQRLRKMLSNYVYWNESIQTLLMDLWALWASYCFFYEKNVKHVLYNVKHFKLARMLSKSKDLGKVLVLKEEKRGKELSVVTPLGDMGDINDAFVQIVVQQLQRIQNERVMIRYLNYCGDMFFRFPLAQRTTHIMLQTELYSRSKEGNPYYGTRASREAAMIAMNKIFSSGVFVRNLIAFAFRLSQPYYSLKNVMRVVMGYLLLLTHVVMKLCDCCCKKEKEKIEQKTKKKEK